MLPEHLKRHLHIILAWLTLALASPLRAADAPFIVDAWTTEDGLHQSSVFSILQTHEGYLWFGTLNGLVRFDGNTFTHFNVNTTPGLPSDRVIFLFEDSRNVLWVGTDNAGLCAIQNGVLKNLNPGDTGGKIIYAYEDEAKGIWFCMENGRFFYGQGGALDLNPPVSPALRNQLFRRAYHVILPHGHLGEFWHLENGHVGIWHDDQPEKDLGAFPWLANSISAAFSASFDASISATCEDHEGNLIVGTRGSGVYWGDAAGGWRQISTHEGLSSAYVLSLCFDREGNLWVGTDGGGLDRVQKNYFTAPAGFPDHTTAMSAAEDADGGFWGTFNTGDLTKGSLTYARTNSSRSFIIGRANNASAVLVDQQQQVWAGSRDQGLFRFITDSFQPVIEAQIIGSPINALLQSRDGKLWIGGQNGLASYVHEGWNFFNAANGLPPNAIRALAESTNGALWIGTEGGGLFSLRAGKISPANAPVKDISCLLVDRDDTLWVGTSGHGLARLSQGQWTTYGSRDGLASDDIGYVIEDDFENLWLGSYEGLMRVEKKSLADFAADKIKKISSRVFLAHECSVGAQPAAIRARDGKLWFPTIQGLVVVNPADLKLDTNPPPVIIESVLVDDVPQKDNPLSPAWPNAITLAPENEQLDIHFTALNFSAPKQRAQLAVSFKYQLLGRDEKFTDIGGERVAHISKLQPNTYRFHVIACNEDGIWNNEGAWLTIIVQPPFWRTKTFLIVATLVLLGVLAGIIYLISTAKLKREVRALHQKELIEHERARIARDLHDQLGANLTQVTLLGEMAEMDKNLPEEVEQHAQQICETARETTRSLDEIVWAVNPSNDTLEGLANYACKYAQDYFALANISFRADLPADLPATPILPEVRHNVFLAFKEAVNNVVKHAQATEARVRLRLEPEQFILSVEDNGRGLGDVSAKKLRNGLKNMRKRLADVSGEFEIKPGAYGGTVARLTVPLKNK